MGIDGIHNSFSSALTISLKFFYCHLVLLFQEICTALLTIVANEHVIQGRSKHLSLPMDPIHELSFLYWDSI